MSDYKKTWRKKVKGYLAAAFGGCCTVCGYDKSISALDYHHLDPEEKDNNISLLCSGGFSWKRIVEEAKKCTIVCCRCHREIHDGITQLPENFAKFNDEYSDIIKLKKAEFDLCFCGQEKNKRNKFCSPECWQNNQKRFDIAKKDLELLIENNTYCAIGKMFGVSDNAIKKRCISLGIELKPRKLRT